MECTLLADFLRLPFQIRNSPIATRFGVYFLHGWCSCLRPFSENVRFVSQSFPLGVPVVSRRCPSSVAVVFQCCRGGVPALVRSCPCPSGILVSRWCCSMSSSVPVVSRCARFRRRRICDFGAVGVPVYFPLGVPAVSRSCPGLWCLGGLLMVSWSCCGGVPLVLRWCPALFRRCPALFRCVPVCVPVVSRRCPSGVPVASRWCSGGVPVSQWCFSGVGAPVSW